MGRKRKSRRELPERMYYKHGAFYFVTKDCKWLHLGQTATEAFKEYANMAVEPKRISTMGQVMDRYLNEVVPDFASPTMKRFGFLILFMLVTYYELAMSYTCPYSSAYVEQWSFHQLIFLI